MRVLVTGGRKYDNQARVNRVLNDLHPSQIAQGGASGADRSAALWAHETATSCYTYPADWTKHGKAAGPIRNQKMLEIFQPDLVVAFPGGRGTEDMVDRARKAFVPVVQFEW